jgi:hypothetical protein
MLVQLEDNSYEVGFSETGTVSAASYRQSLADITSKPPRSRQSPEGGLKIKTAPE